MINVSEKTPEKVICYNVIVVVKMNQNTVGLFVRSQGDYYRGMLKNGWMMPAQNSRICTRDFMDRVRRNELYCPNYKERIMV